MMSSNATVCTVLQSKKMASIQYPVAEYLFVFLDHLSRSNACEVRFHYSISLVASTKFVSNRNGTTYVQIGKDLWDYRQTYEWHWPLDSHLCLHYSSSLLCLSMWPMSAVQACCDSPSLSSAPSSMVPRRILCTSLRSSWSPASAICHGHNDVGLLNRLSAQRA